MNKFIYALVIASTVMSAITSSANVIADKETECSSILNQIQTIQDIAQKNNVICEKGSFFKQCTSNAFTLAQINSGVKEGAFPLSEEDMARIENYSRLNKTAEYLKATNKCTN